jgi:protein arginine N-methyltransferase 1
VGEYPVYDDVIYDGLGADDARRRAYRAAIQASARGRVVLDIGTGRDALWAVEAARAGAGHVYAVEAQPAAAAQARQAIARAGVASQVTVIEGRSEQITVPQPAQVCVSEIVGNIASAEGIIAVIADAARRLCASDCTWIPDSCQTRTAAVDLSRFLTPGDYAIAAEALPYLGRIFTAVGRPFDLRLCLAGPVVDTIVSSVGTVESLRLGHTGQPAPHETTVTDSLLLHPWARRLTGLLLWPTVSCAPGQPGLDALHRATRSWAPVYVAFSATGIPVRPGEQVQVCFSSTISDDQTHPDYHVTTRLQTAGSTRRLAAWHAPHHGYAFRSSDLYQRLFPTSTGRPPRSPCH